MSQANLSLECQSIVGDADRLGERPIREATPLGETPVHMVRGNSRCCQQRLGERPVHAVAPPGGRSAHEVPSTRLSLRNMLGERSLHVVRLLEERPAHEDFKRRAVKDSDRGCRLHFARFRKLNQNPLST